MADKKTKNGFGCEVPFALVRGPARGGIFAATNCGLWIGSVGAAGVICHPYGAFDWCGFGATKIPRLRRYALKGANASAHVLIPK